MNIFKLNSLNRKHRDSTKYPFLERRNLILATSVLAISCLAFTPAWAGDDARATTSLANIHLTGLSIQIGPGGFQLGIGVPYYSYGPVYGYSPRYGRLGYRHFWKPPRHHGHRRHFAPPRRFNRGHGWKNHRPRGNFRGAMGGRSGSGHRGGGRR